MEQQVTEQNLTKEELADYMLVKALQNLSGEALNNAIMQIRIKFLSNSDDLRTLSAEQQSVSENT